MNKQKIKIKKCTRMCHVLECQCAKGFNAFLGASDRWWSSWISTNCYPIKSNMSLIHPQIYAIAPMATDFFLADGSMGHRFKIVSRITSRSRSIPKYKSIVLVKIEAKLLLRIILQFWSLFGLLTLYHFQVPAPKPQSGLLTSSNDLKKRKKRKRNAH